MLTGGAQSEAPKKWTWMLPASVLAAFVLASGFASEKAHAAPPKRIDLSTMSEPSVNRRSNLTPDWSAPLTVDRITRRF